MAKILTKMEAEEMAKKLNASISDEEMAMATGGTGGDNPASRFQVGDHVRLVEGGEDYEDVVIIEIWGYWPETGWYYLIKVLVPDVGWLEVGAVNESDIIPA